MMIYSFAGCVMEGARFLQPFLPGSETSTRGMSTEGVLRLLNGETLSIDEDQLQQILNNNPNSPKGTYFGITKITGIIWTPVSDAIYLTPLARCQDKTTYPFHDGALNSILGTTGASLSFAAIKALWAQLYKETTKISRRAVVYYPTDHLHSGAWKERIERLQRLARDLFNDWQYYTVRPELAEPNGYWAHYSQSAREELWEQIGEGFKIN